MKRGILGLGILLVFLAVGLWSSFAMKHFHQPVSKVLEEAAQTALAGDLETAAASAKEAQAAWEDHWHPVAMLADHAPMDEIDAQFARLEMYAQAGNAADFAACANRLATMITATAEAHTLTWWNLL